MKIAISLLNFRPGQIGGTETYLRQLIPQLVALRGEDRLTLVSFRDNAAAFSMAGAGGAGETGGFAQVVVERGDRQIVRARVLEAFTPYRAIFAERVFAELAPDVVLFPQQSVFPKNIAAPCVLTIHDLQHLYYPENFGLFDRFFRPALYPFSMAKARRLIAISDFTKRTLVERCGIQEAKITTVHHGTELPDITKVKPYAGIGEPYLYYPATTDPHKGHDSLFRSVAALKRQGGFPYKLVLVGKQTGHWPKLQRLIAQLDIARNVVHLGYVSKEEVQSLYAGAAAVVFPTRFEGFGFPVIEAVAFGKKIIASRLEVFDELGLPAQWQIDFEKPEELGRALAKPGPTVLTRAPMTWAECAQKTLAVLRGAAEKG